MIVLIWGDENLAMWYYNDAMVLMYCEWVSRDATWGHPSPSFRENLSSLRRSFVDLYEEILYDSGDE